VPAVRPDAIVKRDLATWRSWSRATEKSGDERVKSQQVTIGRKVGDLVRVDLAPAPRVSAPNERLRRRGRTEAKK